ncbi:hypothetical protein IAU59_001257 [Kwoniella sp. CBS 9459]
MLPTQPINCGKRWWAPPDFHYAMQSRFAWPTPPPLEGAAATAAGLGAGVGAGAGAGTAAGAASHLGAAEGAAAAANFASHAAGGAGGAPPRGPWGGHYHHYYQGGPFGRGYGYGRGWGRRPILKRVFWFGLGAWIGVGWYKRRQEKKAEFNRQIADPNSPLRDVIRDLNRPYPAPTATATQSPSGTTPIDHTPYPAQAQPVPVNPAVPMPAASNNEEKKWGWHDHNERRWGWRHRRYHEWQQQQKKQEADAAAASAKEEARGAAGAASIQMDAYEPPAAHIEQVPQPILARRDTNAQAEQSEMSKIREAVEKLWDEKKRDAAYAQETANDRAKEYAREKLDKLSAALETLRESLKQDQAVKVAKEDKKLV